MLTGRTHDNKKVSPAGLGTAHFLRRSGKRNAVFLERSPKIGWPHVLFGRADIFRRSDITQQTLYSRLKKFSHYRSPSPRAMIPRRISRVPPRSEKEGAIWVRYARSEERRVGKVCIVR